MSNLSMRICLWFDHQAEEAVQFYASIFQDSLIGHKTYFGKEGFEQHGMPEGSVATIAFRLNQMHFVALNGGPIFQFNEAMSIIVECDTQEQIDHYWQALRTGGSEWPCGWLKDRYGVSWQITPRIISDLLQSNNPEAKARVESVLFTMKKLDIRTLVDAYALASE